MKNSQDQIVKKLDFNVNSLGERIFKGNSFITTRSSKNQQRSYKK
jgi:hypothetical protein